MELFAYAMGREVYRIEVVDDAGNLVLWGKAKLDCLLELMRVFRSTVYIDGKAVVISVGEDDKRIQNLDGEF